MGRLCLLLLLITMLSFRRKKKGRWIWASLSSHRCQGPTMSSADIQPFPLFPAHSPLVIQKDLLETQIWSCYSSLPSPHCSHIDFPAAPTTLRTFSGPLHWLSAQPGTSSLCLHGLFPHPIQVSAENHWQGKAFPHVCPHHSLTLYLALSFFISIITNW